jgi:DNA replication and repair protein RecF
MAPCRRQNKISLAYATQFPIDSYETALLHKLEESTGLDVLRGFTAAGPHRDDMKVGMDGHDVSEAASRGETRTLVLALKILELQILEDLHGTKPLLLLDDVFSELDGGRRRALTGYVADYQTFITTTDADVVMQHFANSTIIPLSRN